MDFLKKKLEKILKKLGHYQLKQFWNKLESFEKKHKCKHIPLSKLERAEKSAHPAVEITQLMVGHYGVKAEDVALDVLNEIGRKDLAVKFKDNKEESTVHSKRKMTDYSKQYKEEIKDNLVKIREYNSLPGETVDFNARYTKLILVKKNQQVEEKKMELEAKGKTHTHLMEKHRDSSINIEHLFSAIENERKEPKTVVIQGPSGIGKSFTVHKIMLDWASGKLFPDRFRYVFHLCCRELRIWENNSLEDLIMQCSDTLKPAIQEIQSDPKSVLFIFDGFDELKLFPEDGESKDGKNVATSVVIKLLRKNILREASLLITTRPTALHVLEKIVTIERCVEVVGFLEEEIKDYFIKSFQNEKEAISAFNIIEENKVVLSMCFVPIFCWIVCSIMKTGGQNSEQIMKNMQTDSQVMLHFINHLLEHHCMSSTSGKTEFLQKVNKLAFFGIREEKRVFTEKDLSMCSINTDNNETTFFSKLFFKADARRHVLYHFLHLTVQELFAAIYCVSRSSNEEIEQLLNDSLDTKNQSLIHVVRFIFGLSSVKSQEIMEDGCQIMSNNLRIHLHNWFPKAVMSFRDNPPFLLQLLYCLYEIQDAQFAAYAMTVLSQLNFRRYTLNIIDCTVIKYCIEHTDSLEQLDLCCCNLEEKEIKILWKVIFKSQDIRISVKNMKKDAVEDFCRIISAQKMYNNLQLYVDKTTHMYNFLLQANKSDVETSISVCDVSASCLIHLFNKIIPKYKPAYIQVSGEIDSIAVDTFTTLLKSEDYTPKHLSIKTKLLNEASAKCTCNHLSSCYKVNFAKWELSRDHENWITLEYETGIYKPSVYFLIHTNEMIFGLSSRTEEMWEEYDNKEGHKFSVSGLSELSTLCICKMIIPKCKPSDIQLSGEIGEETVKSVIDILKTEKYTPKNLRLESKNMSEASVKDVCCIEFKDNFIKQNMWQLSQNEEDDIILCYYGGGSWLSITVSGVCTYNLKNICKIAISNFKPEAVVLNGEPNEQIVAIIMEIMRNTDLTLKHLRIKNSNLSHESAERIWNILAEEIKMKNVNWELESGNHKSGFSLKYNIEQSESSFSVDNINEFKISNICKIIIAKFTPMNIELSGELGEHTIKSTIEILYSKGYATQNLRIRSKTLAEASAENICVILPVDNKIKIMKWEINKDGKMYFELELKNAISESRFSVSGFSETVMVGICKIIIPKHKPSEINISGEFGQDSIKSVTEILKNTDYVPQHLSIHGFSLSETSAENICSLLFLGTEGKNMSWKFSPLEESDYKLNHAETWNTLKCKVNGCETSFSFCQKSECNVINICKTIIPKYKPSEIRLTGEFDEEILKSVITVFKDEDYSPDYLRLVIWNLPETSAKHIATILTTEITQRNNSWELIGFRSLNLTYFNIDSDHDDFITERTVTLKYEAGGAESRLSFSDLNEQNMTNLCKIIVPKNKPADFSLCGEFGEETVKSFFEILKNEDYTPKNVRLQIRNLTEVSVENIYTFLHTDKMKYVSWKLYEDYSKFDEDFLFDEENLIILEYKAECSETSLSVFSRYPPEVMENCQNKIIKYRPQNIILCGALGEKTSKDFLQILKNENHTPKYLSIGCSILNNAKQQNICTFLTSENEMKTMSWELYHRVGDEDGYDKISRIFLRQEDDGSSIRLLLSDISEYILLGVSKMIIPTYKPTEINVSGVFGEESIIDFIDLLKNQDYMPKCLRIKTDSLTAASTENICASLSAYKEMKSPKCSQPEAKDASINA
ncbi:uncharacterized protein LOC120528081 isoform X2 [Polypterus senegalus]|uniref:uncharacterized protein LOC120528081 isoform X2 n=1 Tax=Polypterus senegalus TaxID=55291 RepID=UPI0019630144|nr:uncharacterized protein LOC120528081 isoform X2 [Polypterus senegalus]